MARKIMITCAVTGGGAGTRDKNPAVPVTPEEIAAAKSARKHCTDSAPTGSLRRVSRCRSAAQLKAEREAAQESLRNRSTVSGGGGESQ
jgi:hypothetical protein